MKEKEWIKLPKGAFAVKRDILEPSETGLIYDVKPIKLDTGVITYVGEGMEENIGMKIKFRESFAETVIFPDGVEYLYFRDLNLSMYYMMENKDESNKG